MIQIQNKIIVMGGLDNYSSFGKIIFKIYIFLVSQIDSDNEEGLIERKFSQQLANSKYISMKNIVIINLNL